MKWYDKFKIGQRVRVTKKVDSWKLKHFYTVRWNFEGDMDVTVGKVYRIKRIDEYIGYQLETANDTIRKTNYWYPVESLEEENVKGKQLLFDFMQL